MHGIKSLLITATAAFALFLMPAPKANAQVTLGVNIGPAPACPYGYFDYAPYDCAPYGYYGPEWFDGGIFIGAGPWFHGPRGFHGHINRSFDPHYGYHGAMPGHGAYHAPADHFQSFHGTHMSDGHGHSSAIRGGRGR